MNAQRTAVRARARKGRTIKRGGSNSRNSVFNAALADMAKVASLVNSVLAV